MNSIAAELPNPPSKIFRVPFYYGWIHVAVAALAMVGTLPGRTQGLGLITEPLIKDLQIGRIQFAKINLWATIIGAIFGLAVGRFLDRFGSRVCLTFVALGLGIIVLTMSVTSNHILLAALITLTRGFGQSALSVVSITIVGQWFSRRINSAMAIYTVALSIGFMIAFPIVGHTVQTSGWRVAWASIGVGLLVILAPIAFLFVRRNPESCGLEIDGEIAPDEIKTINESNEGYTFSQALSEPSFWIFALSSSVYGLIASGIALFNESILAERGFNANIYYRTLVITALTALVGNFFGGWLAGRWSLKKLMSLAMALLMLSLIALPNVKTETHVTLYAVAMGLVGGAVMVVFFTFWSQAFGRTHLGKIQGAAQTLTVLASAVGPLLLAWCVSLTGSYSAIFYVLAVVVGLLSLCAWFVRVPTRQTN